MRVSRKLTGTVHSRATRKRRTRPTLAPWPSATSLALPRRGVAVEAVLAVVGGLTIGVSFGAAPATGLPLPAAVVSSAALVLLLFLFRRTAPLVPFAVSAVLAVFSPAVTSTMLITSYAVGRYVRTWPLRTAAAVVGFLAVAQPWALDRPSLAVGAVVSAAFVVLLPGSVGAWVRSHSALMAALRERAERAEAERELLARDAVLTERTRIAREMHDAVGHRVSLMVLQAGAVEMAADDRAKVEQLAGQVQDAGRQALDELRQPVGVLRAGDDGATRRSAPQPDLGRPRPAGRGVPVGRHGRRRCHGPPPVRSTRPFARRLPDRAGGADQRRQARPRRPGRVSSGVAGRTS